MELDSEYICLSREIDSMLIQILDMSSGIGLQVPLP
jgi:hypothetical protein